MNAQELKDALCQFTGTEQWYIYPLNKKIVYTDGARFFFREAAGGAYWLLDILGTEVYQFHAKEEFLFIALNVIGTRATITVTNGNHEPDSILLTKAIDYTDCPDGEWKFFMIWDGQRSTILLPSEY